MRTKKFQRMLVALMMVCMMGMLGVSALAEDGGITITSQSVQETTEDLTVDYAYPAFAADDEALAQALDAAITQACAAQLEALREEYKVFAADRTEEQQQLYTDDEAYRDEITGTYDVLSNDGRLLQILTTVSYRPAGGNGDWDRLNTYVFDLEGQRLLALTDVFADEESAIYAALTEAVTARLDTLEGIYDGAAVIVDADTCFYLDDAEMALHLVFEPYALSKEDQDVALDIGALPLEPTAVVPGDRKSVV